METVVSKSKTRTKYLIGTLLQIALIFATYELSIGYYKMQTAFRKEESEQTANSFVNQSLKGAVSYNIISVTTDSGNLNQNNSAFFTRTRMVIEVPHDLRRHVEKALLAERKYYKFKINILAPGVFTSIHEDYRSPANPQYLMIEINTKAGPVTLGEYLEWL